ncbi:unnamed protein product [Mytilus coruscus]|uniref:DUF4218 domain-containing protein n=1 Tax=Mytilus coruscus TaxID=42192 RepID=A0A6J8DPJ5_MYTCO|nr:unnamed protein product [Mytilus coruscus]
MVQKVRAAERASGRNAELCPDAVYRIYVKEKKTLGQKRKKKDVAEVEESSILQTKYPKNELPQAPYVLTAEEKKEADRRLANVKVPVNFGVLPGSLFTKIVGGTKCHTWLQLFSNGIIRFCIRGMLGTPQRTSLVNFLLVLEEAYGCSFDMDLIDNFEKRWHEALCLMERDFPAALQTFYFHLLHHLPQYIRLYGPPRNFWMFPYERFNHTLTEAVSNNQYPELSAIKKVEVQWLITFYLTVLVFSVPLK